MFSGLGCAVDNCTYIVVMLFCGIYRKQECIPVGCVPAARRPYAGVCGGVCLVRGGLPGPRGVLHPGGSAWSPGGLPGPGGVPPSGGGMASQHALRQTPSPRGQTHTCKNITLATTSLRPVKMPQTNNKTLVTLPQ